MLRQDRGAALSQFEKCAQALRQGLDIEPSAETNALYERIKREEIGPTVETGANSRNHEGASLNVNLPPHNLPQHPLNFIGPVSYTHLTLPTILLV